jgi:hypothetical protein
MTSGFDTLSLSKLLTNPIEAGSGERRALSCTRRIVRRIFRKLTTHCYCNTVPVCILFTGFDSFSSVVNSTQFSSVGSTFMMERVFVVVGK